MKSSVLTVSRRLKFYQLVVFEHVVQSGSILRAAQVLNMTQPAVTKVMHEVESYFCAPLLVRSNRGVRLTELGELVLRRARTMLAELRALTDEVEAYQEGVSGHVVVGTLISASTSLLPLALRLLKARAPHVLVSVRIGQFDQLFPALIVGEVDLVIGRVPDDWRGREESRILGVDTLYDECLSIVGGSRHPLHDEAVLSLADLHSYPWILPPPGSLLRRTVNELFADADLALPANVIESLSVLTNVALMQDQKTVGLLPMETARQLSDHGGIQIFNFLTPLHFGGIGCFYANNRDLGPAAKLFRECTRHASERHVITD
ncbi:DNA-binding transcriptional regulator, LysR family [Pseudomonas sp. URIL14HWK12:I8]|uniref:LysR family transcriptional regulator n=1 Tax=unclassified Pseudomonas TaxID=196821 RepID=UPI0004813C57|nr:MULTISPECIES: LysR family transcriptional regulator [unclassified Pseudomonas]SNB80090.1 DNA-binding transcriptional regulator, LysR family [Pseudomonas sp. URIL14HWK12:I8]